MNKDEIVQENSVLKAIVDKSATKPEAGALVEGPVITIRKSSVFVDLSPFGTGIIYGREFINAKDIIKKVNIDDAEEANKIFDILMGSEVPPRKSFIQSNAKLAEIDI